VKEMIPEFVVPDLTDFKVCYVVYSAVQYLSFSDVDRELFI